MFALCDVCFLWLFKISGNFAIVKPRTKGAQKVLLSLEKSVLSCVASAEELPRVEEHVHLILGF